MAVSPETLGQILQARQVVLDRERELARDNGPAFMQVFLPDYMHVKSPSFHEEMFRICLKTRPEEWVGRSGAVFAAPRGHAKSTIASLAVPLNWGLYRKKRFVVIISNTDQQAFEFATSLRAEFEDNEAIRDHFGDLRGDRFINGAFRWTNQDFTIAHTDPPGSTNIHDVVWTTRYVARGMLSKIRGLRTRSSRPDALILDDCENDEHVQTPEQRTKTWNYFSKALLPMLDPRDRTLIVVGTILHYDSLLAKLLRAHNEQGEPIYVTRKWKAIDEQGRILWPELFPPEKLAEIRSQISGYAFSSEYLNEPIDVEARKFRPEWIQWYTNADLEFRDGVLYFKGSSLRNVAGVDQAIEEKEDKAVDQSALNVVGVTLDRRCVVLYTWADRVDFPAQVAMVKSIVREWGVTQTGIEQAAYQRALGQQILHDGWLSIRQLKNTAPKYERITGMSIAFENLRVYLRACAPDEPGSEWDELKQVRVHPNALALYTQLMQFPMAQHDDIVDALCNAMQVATGDRGFTNWF